MTVSEMIFSGIVDTTELSRRVYQSNRKLYCKMHGLRNYKLETQDYITISDFFKKNFDIYLDAN